MMTATNAAKRVFFWGLLASAPVLLLAICAGFVLWELYGPKEDDTAIEKLKGWGAGYGRHVIVLWFPAGNVSTVTFTGKVDPEKMDTLCSLKHPHHVAFSRCTFTEEGLLLRILKMRGIGSVRSLHLLHDTVTDDDLIALLPLLETVEYLYLQDNPITDRSINAIASMPSLRAVCIHGTKITPEGKARLRSLRPKLNVDDVLQPPF
jgi:hypothetical protein